MFTIPNFITLLRIFLVPFFVMSIVYKRFDLGFYVFLLAALTDALDGLIARLKNQKSRLGAFLDPLADKLLLLTAFLSLTILELIPKWLTVIIISRDLIVVIGWISLYIQTGSTRVEPSVPGKLSNTLQVITIVSVLINLNFSIFNEVLETLYVLTSFFAIFSCIHYILRDIKAYEQSSRN
ncbi:MAG: CDP-diacylglycerol--glycerol-3-phosphate 3-phosphatidyltransferase [Thermodesulfovibrionales bacterium]|nr:CDP-diacylglycerol--glycerol-3-phosphate 3-phosphatidyltransferase [Thermodesulfovibrionales bacterium]